MIGRNTPHAPATPPATAEEAEARFWRRYGMALLVELLGADAPAARPASIEAWVALAVQVRDAIAAPPSARLAAILEQAAVELRRGAGEAAIRREYGRHQDEP